MFDTWSQILHVQRELLRKLKQPGDGDRPPGRRPPSSQNFMWYKVNGSHVVRIEKHLSSWSLFAPVIRARHPLLEAVRVEVV